MLSDPHQGMLSDLLKEHPTIFQTEEKSSISILLSEHNYGIEWNYAYRWSRNTVIDADVCVAIAVLNARNALAIVARITHKQRFAPFTLRTLEVKKNKKNNALKTETGC